MLTKLEMYRHVSYRRLLLLLVTLISVFSACKKTNGFNNHSEASKSVLDMSAYSPQEKRVIYNLLSETEKCNMWKTHLVHCLVTEARFPSQRQFIQEMIDYLTPSFFSHKVTSEENLKLGTFRARCIELFGFTKSVYILNSLDNIDTEEPATNSFESGQVCDCSIESDWCSGFTSCRAVTCTAKEDGCGTFWHYSCNGICRY